MIQKENASIWIPELAHQSEEITIQQVLDSYSVFLEVAHPQHHEPFRGRLKSNPDGAKAEACIYAWLLNRQLEPRVAESPKSGGPDFVCTTHSGQQITVEVTALNGSAVERKSQWPDVVDAGPICFDLITSNLWLKAESKDSQLQGTMPGVLVVCLSHVGASALMGSLAAQCMMTSDTSIAVPVGEDSSATMPYSVSNFRNAVFFQICDGAIVPIRRNISAIFLVAIWDREICVVGILHPDPIAPLDYRAFGNVPFLRFEKWPIGSTVSLEWVVGSPEPASAYHSIVPLTDGCLKGS